MSVRRISLAALVLAIGCAAGFQANLFGQTNEIVIKVTSTGDRAIRFRGAVMFQEGGLQIVEGETPFEVRGRGGVALGVFERQGDGPEIRVELSTGQGTASGSAGRVIVGTGEPSYEDALANGFEKPGKYPGNTSRCCGSDTNLASASRSSRQTR